MTKEDNIIPIDSAIEAFRRHLDTHDRTILSAKFGDGKTFFLSHFVNDPTVNNQYEFLTIYPINYQVADNNDIFELIKRDILLQMLSNGIIEPNLQIPEEISLLYYLQDSGFFDIFKSFLPVLKNTPSTSLNLVAKFADSINKSINSVQEKIKNGNKDEQIEQFLRSFDNNYVVGTDPITSLIQNCIIDYKKTSHKKIVLVIEDLDRLDPAHLFRILNIFSAHVDFAYSLGFSPHQTLIGNKFDLDKIIFVMHYENVKNIFHHFYGLECNFDGYIEKFCSSNPFHYSLRQQRESYFTSLVSKETGVDASVIDFFIKSSDYSSLSIRRVVNSLDKIKGSVKENISFASNTGKKVTIHNGIICLISFLKRIGVSETDILQRMKDAIHAKGNDKTLLFNYIAPHLCYVKSHNPIDTIRFNSSTDVVNSFYVAHINDDGTASCVCQKFLNYDNDADKRLNTILVKLMNMSVN